MFDFLRNLRDEVVAEVSLIGCNCGGRNKSSDSNQNKLINIIGKDDGDYLTAIGYKYGSLYPAYMEMIREKNLQYLDPETIYQKLDFPLLTPDTIDEVLEAYSLMNFFREKDYSSEEASAIMKIANIYDSNIDKPVSEIAMLANCSEESVNSVVKLVCEYKNKYQSQTKPFTMESATPLSGQKPVVQPPKTTSSKTNKKTATAAS